MGLPVLCGTALVAWLSVQSRGSAHIRINCTFGSIPVGLHRYSVCDRNTPHPMWPPAYRLSPKLETSCNNTQCYNHNVTGFSRHSVSYTLKMIKINMKKIQPFSDNGSSDPPAVPCLIKKWRDRFINIQYILQEWWTTGSPDFRLGNACSR